MSNVQPLFGGTEADSQCGWVDERRDVFMFDPMKDAIMSTAASDASTGPPSRWYSDDPAHSAAEPMTDERREALADAWSEYLDFEVAERDYIVRRSAALFRFLCIAVVAAVALIYFLW